MAVSFQWNLDGYESAYATEINGGKFGLKIFIKIDHELTDDEKKAFYRADAAIQEAVMKESERLKPETASRAVRERAEILDLFPVPIFVEEIPNGYCSRYCCAFKPWFIVTTHRGRIRIGWRKSVIHLEWTDSAIKGDAAEIFPKEEAWPGYETTQFDKTIHCHGYDKAREYIGRLLAA